MPDGSVVFNTKQHGEIKIKPAYRDKKLSYMDAAIYAEWDLLPKGVKERCAVDPEYMEKIASSCGFATGVGLSRLVQRFFFGK